jgi:hypothetical protein
VNAPPLDRFGEPIEPVDDDDPVDTTPRTAAEILARCAQLRAVLAAARARREVDQ